MQCGVGDATFWSENHKLQKKKKKGKKEFTEKKGKRAAWTRRGKRDGRKRPAHIIKAPSDRPSWREATVHSVLILSRGGSLAIRSSNIFKRRASPEGREARRLRRLGQYPVVGDDDPN